MIEIHANQDYVEWLMKLHQSHMRTKFMKTRNYSLGELLILSGDSLFGFITIGKFIKVDCIFGLFGTKYIECELAAFDDYRYPVPYLYANRKLAYLPSMYEDAASEATLLGFLRGKRECLQCLIDKHYIAMEQATMFEMVDSMTIEEIIRKSLRDVDWL